MRVALHAIILVAVCNLGAVTACEDTTPAVPCVDGPPSGCPEDFGADVCRDPSCSAVYACDNGKWTFVRACRSDGGSD